MKILIADDDQFSRSVLKTMLNSFQYEAVEANDGLEAWEKYQKDKFPVVIIDWVMPGLDGLELCCKIRSCESGKYPYLILLTSKDGKQNYLTGINSGADDFLNKPLDKDLLYARLLVAKRIQELQKQNLELAHLLPICSYCLKARDDKDYWQKLDQYLMENTKTQISHGVCPDCYENIVLPELEEAMHPDNEE